MGFMPSKTPKDLTALFFIIDLLSKQDLVKLYSLKEHIVLMVNILRKYPQ